MIFPSYLRRLPPVENRPEAAFGSSHYSNVYTKAAVKANPRERPERGLSLGKGRDFDLFGNLRVPFCLYRRHRSRSAAAISNCFGAGLQASASPVVIAAG
jgi:hypothetical protein